ncbi:MAG: type II toxin-antitoxin system VapC family toxin [Thermoplasmata archaeon]|nr:type II toxin-antitoxin system VapC family toxin [Thermoplasmata archaeon]
MKQKGSQNKKYIIDSYGWIEYFSESKLADKYSKYIEKSTPSNYFTPTIIIYEVYKKFKSFYTEEDAITAVANIENCTTVIDINSRLAIKGADSSLEQKLPMADAIIWGVADEINAKIVTSDLHFKNQDNVIFIE